MNTPIDSLENALETKLNRTAINLSRAAGLIEGSRDALNYSGVSVEGVQKTLTEALELIEIELSKGES